MILNSLCETKTLSQGDVFYHWSTHASLQTASDSSSAAVLTICSVFNNAVIIDVTVTLLLIHTISALNCFDEFISSSKQYLVKHMWSTSDSLQLTNGSEDECTPTIDPHKRHSKQLL